MEACFETEEELQSQRCLNENMILEGDVDVQYAPVLSFLKVPDRKAMLYAAFKLPGGLNRNDNAPKKTLGARRRRKVAIPGFTNPNRCYEPESEDVPICMAVEEAEPAANSTVATAPQQIAVAEPLVLYEPPEGADGCTRVEVEGIVCRHLREHQREGVKFMFDCVHGLKPYGGNGCILADDMGLGKTLQSITLLHTVLRQGIHGTPTAKRAIIVCPTSLVANWAKEIRKWVGDSIKPLPISEASRDRVIMDVNTFLSSRTYPVLIISYETFRIHAARFHARPDCCDLLICDEAHRLKNERTLTTQALAGLACRRRVLLSGTPMQNDLEEFYAMVDFTNPGVLGDVAHFRKKYESPILAAREPWATDKQKVVADEAGTELSNIVNQFILRRTNTLLSKHLPPKLMQVVCVRMSPLQHQLYEHFLSSKELSLIMSGRQSGVLASITALRKLVNHPKLIYDAVKANQRGAGKKDEGAAGFQDCEQFFPDQFHRERSACAEMSGKFELTARMLTMLRTTTTDRIVIVSCYTQTLDLFTALCREHNWPVIRLDGSTGASKRQKFVDTFNDPKNDEFVFLLSSKAGGCGLNLIGANRLILFDPDWNPATDLQAAARVWRDGQTKKVYVYRFLAAGTLEEKVFQRQLSKKGLQTIVVEEGDEVNTLSSDDLRNLFQMPTDTPSDTHDMLRCVRCRKDELADGDSDGEIEANLAKAADVVVAVAEPVAGANEAMLPIACDDGCTVSSGDKRPQSPASKCSGNSDAKRARVLSEAVAEMALAKRGSSDSPGGTCGVASHMDADEELARALAADEELARALAAEEDAGCSSQYDMDDADDDVPKRKKAKAKQPSKGKTAQQGGTGKRPTKAALKRAERAAALEQKAFDAAVQAAMKESLSKPLPPVAAGTHRRQLKWPNEDDLKCWSHHHGCETTADTVLAEAGKGLVSFVFGCEVKGRDPADFAVVAPPTKTASSSKVPSKGFNPPAVSSSLPRSFAPSTLAVELPKKRLGPPKVRRTPLSTHDMPAANFTTGTPFKRPLSKPGQTAAAQSALKKPETAKPRQRKKAHSDEDSEELAESDESDDDNNSEEDPCGEASSTASQSKENEAPGKQTSNVSPVGVFAAFLSM